MRTPADVEEIARAVGSRCEAIGKRVAVVVNYDGFKLDDQVADLYSAMAEEMVERHYSKVSRYTTSAFLRMKLGAVLTRGVAPHIFETREEAQAFAKAKG